MSSTRSRAPRASWRSTSTWSTRSPARRRSPGSRQRGLTVHRPGQTVATADHSIPTHDRSLPIADLMAAAQVAAAHRQLHASSGSRSTGWARPTRGSSTSSGRELGLTQPGMTIVCGDSHTATHGAFGALAFGIGTSEVEMVLATQCLLQRRPKTYEVRVDGRLPPGVSAKDIILALIARIGVGGGTGHVFEYTGSAIRGPDDGAADDRSATCASRAAPGPGLIAPDDTTFEYVAGRPHAPKGAAWDAAVAALADAAQRRGRRATTSSITIDAVEPRADGHLRHEPGDGHADHAPDPGPGGPGRSVGPAGARARARVHGPRPRARRSSARRSTSSSSARAPTAGSATCAWRPRSCKGRQVADGVRVMVVPGSEEVKKRGRARGPRRDLPGRRRRVARGRLLDVHRDERRPADARPVRDQHLEPQLRGPPGQGRPDVPRLAADRRRVGDRRASITDPRTLPGIEASAGVGGR